MESLPYYCKSSKLCKQINHSNPERPKPLRFLHHLWGHQCTKESSEACPHERISSDTDTNTEEKGVNLTGIFESKSWPALTRTSPTASSNRSEAFSAQQKPKRERKRKNEHKRKWKKVDIFRFLVGERSSMTRIAIARKYLNRIESKPPWFQSLKFNFPVISRQSLLSVQNAELTRRVENGFL